MDGRQVSQGAIWAVGGLAPGPSTTDDGQGHLVRSRTNARVFSTTFSAMRPNTEEDLEKYQGRVASALDIDRARKVLDFDGHGTFPRCADKRTMPECPSRTTWTGTAWTELTESYSQSDRLRSFSVVVLTLNRAYKGWNQTRAASSPIQVSDQIL